MWIKSGKENLKWNGLKTSELGITLIIYGEIFRHCKGFKKKGEWEMMKG